MRKHGYNVYEAPNWIGFYEIFKNLFARDAAKDPLMTTFQDFDWADEVVHAGFGEKWGVEAIYKGDIEKAVKAGNDTWEKRSEFMLKVAQGEYQPKSPYGGDY